MPEFKTVQDTVPAGETRYYSCCANTVRVIYASAPFELGTDDGALGWIDAGMGLTTQNVVRRVRVKVAAGAALTFLLALYEGNIQDNRIAGSVSSLVSRPANIADAAPVTLVAADPAVEIIAARAEREEAFVTNLGPGPVILGAAPAAALGAFYLASGETYVLKTTAAIKAYATAAGNATLWLGETYHS